MPAPPSAAESRLDTRYATETPEGIALWLRPAGVVPRFYAYVLDAVDPVRRSSASRYLLLTLLGGFGMALALMLFFLLEWLYPVAFELSAGAATPGKRMFGLTVVMDNGLPVTPAASITRNLLRAADFLPLAATPSACSRCCSGTTASASATSPPGTLVVHAAARRDPARRRSPPGRRARRCGRSPRDDQAAIVALRRRASPLTEARARRARRAAPRRWSVPRATGARVTSPRSLGVAQWVLGRR